MSPKEYTHVCDMETDPGVMLDRVRYAAVAISGNNFDVFDDYDDKEDDDN